MPPSPSPQPHQPTPPATPVRSATPRHRAPHIIVHTHTSPRYNHPSLPRHAGYCYIQADHFPAPFASLQQGRTYYLTLAGSATKKHTSISLVILYPPMSHRLPVIGIHTLSHDTDTWDPAIALSSSTPSC